MTEELKALLKGVAVFFFMIGFTGICYSAATPLTYLLLVLSIILFITIRNIGSKNE